MSQCICESTSRPHQAGLLRLLRALVTGEGTEEDVRQEAAPVVLFQGAGLTSSSAATVSPHNNEEFDYAFNHESREVHATTKH